MARGGSKKKNKVQKDKIISPNRIPRQGTSRDDACCICLEEFDMTYQEDSGILCSSNHGVCRICVKQLLMPCLGTLRGTCNCSGVSWKCPICRSICGFPNAWTAMSLIMTDEEADKAINRANLCDEE